MFPAQALAGELAARGWTVHLATDERGLRYSDDFADGAVHVVRSATFASKNPIKLANTVGTLFSGYLAARKLVKRLGADVCVGFGGYPTVPPVMAAAHLGVPTVLHEQNAVLGRANALLERSAKAVAAGFSSDSLPDRAFIMGNPLRATVLDIARRLGQSDAPYTASKVGEPFDLLVFGGSQGATFFGEVVPAALAHLSETERGCLRLTLQARDEAVAAVKTALAPLVEHADVAPFFKDMPERIERAHLVVARAGASTVSEIAAIGRPSILVPYPHALDHDQAANAQQIVERGGAVLARQQALTPEALADHIRQAMAEPERLAAQAHAAAMTAQLYAAEQLADLVVSIAEQG